MQKGRLLITGGAGFIGYHLARAANKLGYTVGIYDNYCEHLYDNKLKYKRVDDMKDTVTLKRYHEYVGDIRDENDFLEVIEHFDPTHVVHLAALAGVRDSFDKASEYIDVNIAGTASVIKVLEGHNSRTNSIQKVLYASTSCVAAGQPLPWREDDPIRHQLNPYGYTKYINECQMKLSNIHSNAFRFFTVYGTWGRPDMALWQWVKALERCVYIKNSAGPIIYNKGEMTRDWTHVDDIVGGILTILHADTPHGEVYNIGRNNPQNILEVYKLVHAWFYDIPVSEVPLDHIDWQEKHAADTVDTWADTTKLEKLGYKCSHDVKDRIKEFVDWVKKNG